MLWTWQASEGFDELVKGGGQVFESATAAAAAIYY